MAIAHCSECQTHFELPFADKETARGVNHAND